MDTKSESIQIKILAAIPKVLKLMDAFSFAKIAILAIAIFFCICSWSIWENRELITNQLLHQSSPTIGNWSISDRTKSTIIAEVVANPNVAWIVVTEMDLGANLRKFKYWYNEDTDLDKRLEYKLWQTSNQPIFDFDKDHTAQMLSVLQNEFVCEKFNKTTFINRVPELSTQTDYVCKIAIPPFYGRFVGILSIGVKGELTDDVKFSVKSIASNIAATIYWRDVIKLPR